MRNTKVSNDSHLLIVFHASKFKSCISLYLGYQKQLGYKRADGSYSPFGKIDQEGSVWLTAFVVKTFAAARKWTYVDYTAYISTLSVCFIINILS